MSTTAPSEQSILVDAPRRRLPQYGQRVSDVVVAGRELQAAVFNENEVRAAAGLTMAIGAIAFSYAYFIGHYTPLKVVTAFFFVEFGIRVTIGLHRSPVGLLARALTPHLPPDWVSAKPKRFAWSMGLAISAAMTVITNSNIHGWLPRSLCLLCLALMWSESVLGYCLGCQMYVWMVRLGWRERDPDIEVCAGGVCELPSARLATAAEDL